MKYKSTREQQEELGFVSDLRFDIAQSFMESMLTNSAIKPESVPLTALRLADEFLTEAESLGYIKQG